MIRDIAANREPVHSELRLAAAALLGVLGDDDGLLERDFDSKRMLLRVGRYCEAVASIYGLPLEAVALRERRATLPFLGDDAEADAYMLPDDGLLTITVGVIAVVPADMAMAAHWLRAGLIDYPYAAGLLTPSQTVVRLLSEECRLDSPVQIKFAPAGVEAVPCHVP